MLNKLQQFFVDVSDAKIRQALRKTSLVRESEHEVLSD
jgi:hypothetical protein